MRILIANDKFKGSLEAETVALCIKKALEKGFQGATIDLCPIADGGEGTSRAMVAAMKGKWRKAMITDALGRPARAAYGWVETDQLAILEMSAASGLSLVADSKLKPMEASTLGTGNLMKEAFRSGATRVIIGIGGSATNDGGLGVAIALGYRFSRKGRFFRPTLETVLEADQLHAPAEFAVPEVIVACDVNNPLLGPNGATRIYGPQKGVADFAWFESRLEHLAHLVQRDLGIDARDIPGAGAAGGLGFGLMAFARGRLTGGFDLVAKQIGLAARVKAADLVITGEGKLDEQSLQGKGPVGVARLARASGKKVVGVAGSITDSAAVRGEFDLLIPIKPGAMSLPEAMRRTNELIAYAVTEATPSIARLMEIS